MCSFFWISYEIGYVPMKVEERIECVVSKKVRYSKRDDTILTLPVPLEAATNKGKSLFIYS